MRVYTVSRKEWPGPSQALGTFAFACLNPRGHPMLLASTEGAFYHRKRVGTVDTKTIAIHAPWVAFARRVSYTDTSTLYVVAMNLQTTMRRVCRAGGSFAPIFSSYVSDIAVTRDGTVAWIGGFTHHGRLSSAKVVTCGSTGSETTLDEGESIDLHSLKLRGSTVTWMNSGKARSAELP
jgi:hypothetical protein